MNEILRKMIVVSISVLILAILVAGSVVANPRLRGSRSDVYWTWDPDTPTGKSVLVRTNKGIAARYRPSGLTPGNAVTGWAIVFNQPQNCLPEPFDCGPDDMFHPDYPGQQGPAEGDFLITRGHVIDANGEGYLSGVIRVNDNSGSGLAEVICPETLDCTGGLTNPKGALFVLATHDHGPALTGQDLQDQISSFLGGCIGPFNGDDFGFAMSSNDIPDEDHECSTTQVSAHIPRGN